MVGVRAGLADGGNAAALTGIRHWSGAGRVQGAQVESVGPSGLRFYIGVRGISRRIWDADDLLAAGAFDLVARKPGVATQRLVAVVTVEFEFVGIHVHPVMRNPSTNSMDGYFRILSRYFLRME